ncbi:MAG: flagellar biosynthetic protein FliR [Lachnospiraceae bacterium]|nr:flagellar biosynthetic protein FliR [Lachnospiraceae bacterium]
MIEETFSIYHLEYFLVILVRVMGVLAYAPIFGNMNVSRRARLFIGIGIAYAMISIHPYEPLAYTTFIEYSIILLKELVVGVTIGFMANVTLSIINMAGQFIDREMGFSMVSSFDANFGTETTITAQFYEMLVMVIMLASNMHYFIISALADSFELIPVGEVMIDTGTLYDVMLQYITTYFVIALRICLPILVATIIVSVVLGVLAKTAPQMNMFVVGIQLKIFAGFAVLFVTLQFLPIVTNYVYEQMQVIVEELIKVFMSQ